MTLAERIADHIQSERRLRRVPLPIIEAVLAVGFERLSEIVPMATPASEITAIEFEWCEVCGHAIDPDNTEGARMDSEGVWLCNACFTDRPEAPWCEKAIGGSPTLECQLPRGHDGKCVPTGTGA